MTTGTVKFFTVNQGFGFITQESGPEIYFHEHDLPPGTELSKNDVVEFDIEPNKRDPSRLRAKNIKLI